VIYVQTSNQSDIGQEPKKATS